MTAAGRCRAPLRSGPRLRSRWSLQRGRTAPPSATPRARPEVSGRQSPADTIQRAAPLHSSGRVLRSMPRHGRRRFAPLCRLRCTVADRSGVARSWNTRAPYASRSPPRCEREPPLTLFAVALA